jgi:serine/threonine protein kinase
MADDDPNSLHTSGRFGPLHVGEFEILETLGRGRLGMVYKAIRPQLGRIVALKVLDPELATDAEQVKRFLREARSVSKLRHPAVIALHDVGTCPNTGLHYLALEFVDGLSLGEELRRVGMLPERRALEICHELAGALECAEKHGIVHRDVKPDHVFLTAGGRAKLSGLGLAKRSDSNSLTAPGTLLGSPHYVSPEQVLGDVELDVRADMYSLGITLYRMVTGELPFDGRSFFEVAEQHVGGEVPDPREHSPRLSESVTTIVAGLCARDREDRYGSAKALGRDLARVLTGATARGPAGPPTSEALRHVVLPEEAPPTLPFEVLVQLPGEPPRTHRFDKDHVTVGRSAGCDLVIDHGSVSRMHAEFRREGLTLAIAPLSSTNATVLNDDSIRESVLVSMDDMITLSDSVMLALRWVRPKVKREPEVLEGLRTHVLVREEVFEGSAPLPVVPLPTERLRDGRPDGGGEPGDSTVRVANAGDEIGSPLPMGYVVYERAGESKRERVQKGFQLGSSSLCDVRLPDPAPRKAALIVRCDECYQLWNVCDDASLVTLNGESVPDTALLADEDVVSVCGVEVVFECPVERLDA